METSTTPDMHPVFFFHFSFSLDLSQICYDLTYNVSNSKYALSFLAYPFYAGKLIKRKHKVTGDVTVLDKKTFLISNMTFDGML